MCRDTERERERADWEPRPGHVFRVQAALSKGSDTYHSHTKKEETTASQRLFSESLLSVHSHKHRQVWSPYCRCRWLVEGDEQGLEDSFIDRSWMSDEDTPILPTIGQPNGSRASSPHLSCLRWTFIHVFHSLRFLYYRLEKGISLAAIHHFTILGIWKLATPHHPFSIRSSKHLIFHTGFIPVSESRRTYNFVHLIWVIGLSCHTQNYNL